MKGKIIFLIVFVVLVLGGVGYFYFSEDNFGSITQEDFQNISISAYDSDKLIGIKYKVYVNNTFYSEGSTSKFGGTLQQIPINNSYKVLLFDDEGYYNLLSKEYYSSTNIQRVDLYPELIGDLDVVHYGNFGIDDNLTILLHSSNSVQGMLMCIRWTYNIFEIDVNYTVIENPNAYKNYDKCYDLNTDLKNQNKIVNLNYSLFGQLTSDDFIELVFIDSQNTISGQITEKNNEDVGMINVIYQIR